MSSYTDRDKKVQRILIPVHTSEIFLAVFLITKVDNLCSYYLKS